VKLNFFAQWLRRQESIRIKTIEDWIKSLPKGKKLLDAGAGHMPFKSLCLSNEIDYISQDFGEYIGGETWGNSTAEEWSAKKCSIQSDITDIPLKDETFDYILCTEVLEHVFSIEKALTELVRLVKKQGEILITIPFCCLPHQKPYFFTSGISNEWFEKFANDSNCQINTIKVGNISTQIIKLSIIRASNTKNLFYKIGLYFISLQLFLADKLIRSNIDAYDSLIVFLKKN